MTPLEKYIVVAEYSAPTFYNVETDKIVYSQTDEDVQAYWVVSLDENGDIEEWIDRFYDEAHAKQTCEACRKGEYEINE